MTLTNNDAREILHSILDFLREINAREVLDGIDETRRMGIEERLTEGRGSELKQVAGIRRRPPNESEMLEIVMERLNQRLIVVPLLAASIEKRFGSRDLRWRVDTEFSSVDRFPDASLQDLLPSGAQGINNGFKRINDLMTRPDGEVSR
jgi:hypothetical protein